MGVKPNRIFSLFIDGDDLSKLYYSNYIIFEIFTSD